MKRYVSLKDALDERIAREYGYYKCSFKEVNMGDKKDILYMKFAKGFIFNNLKNIKFYDVLDDANFILYDDLIDVSKDKRFSIDGVLDGDVKSVNYIIEGADGTGKSTITKRLALSDGLICQDRNVSGISKYVSSDDYSFYEKVNKVYDFLSKNKDSNVLFLVLSDLEEMKKRIFSRPRVTKYDLNAINTQKAYIDIYNELKDTHNLDLLDIKGMSRNEVYKNVRKRIYDKN